MHQVLLLLLLLCLVVVLMRVMIEVVAPIHLC